MSPMNPRLLRPRASGGFDPSTVANLAFWLDASDSNTVSTVSGAVSEWRSKVSGSTLKASQSSSTLRPAYVTAGRNGRNTVLFDSTNDVLDTDVIGLPQPFTIVVTASYAANPLPGVSPSRVAWVLDGPSGLAGNTASNRILFGWNSGGSAAFNGELFSGSLTLGAGNAAGNTDWSVLTAVWNGASSSIRANGTSVKTGNIGSNTINALTIGNAAAVGQSMNGPIGAILIYSRALSDSELQTVERGIGSIWGITVA